MSQTFNTGNSQILSLNYQKFTSKVAKIKGIRKIQKFKNSISLHENIYFLTPKKKYIYNLTKRQIANKVLD